MNFSTKVFSLLLGTALLLSACTAQPSPEITATAARTVTATAPTVPPTRTPFVAAPTATPRPTLSPAETTALIETNGGCRFPCWMGITPGQSKWDEVEPYLLTFLSKYHTQYGPRKTYSFTISMDNTEHIISQISVSDNNVDLILALRPIEETPIWKTLSEYGKPSEIRILPMGHYAGVGFDVPGEFTLVFYYPEQGIMAAYSGDTEAGKVLHACPVNTTLSPDSWWLLWYPQKPLTFAQAGTELHLPQKGIDSIEEDYLSIEEVTDFTVDTFYETYRVEANAAQCFDIQDPEWVGK